MHEYEVIVGNIGTVYTGTSQREAISRYRTYRHDSLSGYGRCAGEPVVLFEDGEIVREYPGVLRDQED